VGLGKVQPIEKKVEALMNFPRSHQQYAVTMRSRMFAKVRKCSQSVRQCSQ